MINSGSKVNAMSPAYTAMLYLISRPTNIGAQKFDGLLLKTYEMVTAGFLMEDKLKQIGFFEETFLLANIHIEVVLGMSFLLLSNLDIKFMKSSILA